MFNVLLLFLGFAGAETNKKHLLCSSSKFEAFYEMCGKNIDRLQARVQIWKDNLSVSDRKYVLCTGVDDEYDFCGALKGETLKLYRSGRAFTHQYLFEGLYTMKAHLLVGEKEELLSCFTLTLNLKAPLI
ncbi:lymphocyte antigen 96 isoform X2 [Engystomops pustulosus]|uniref:lymphocyte antigen 96 isoform X2 n=1 Tax=Engystomops pustulosus TaxID=76066 RepID=UPI003AFB1674